MNDYPESINRQYGRRDLSAHILKALEESVVAKDSLTIEDLAWFDQLHFGGINSTRMLASKAVLKPGMEVLDIGCGIGGPARTLAAEFGCKVLGIDLSEEYVKAARLLTDTVHLSKNVDFHVGDATKLKYENEAFDVVWTQSAFMNIKHKSQLLREVHRVLRSNGIFVFEAQMKGSKEESRFPVFWADSDEVSFLISSTDFQQLVQETGFTEVLWEDITSKTVNRIQRVQATSDEGSHPLADIFSLVQSDLPQKRKNTLLGLLDGTYIHIHAVYGLAA